MNPNILPSKNAVLAGVIDPDLHPAGTYTTGWIDMSEFEAIQAVVMAGALGTSATLDAKLEQATDASGTGAKDIAGKSITQLTEAGGDSNKQAIINCRSDELDVNNGFTHVRLSMTVAVASSDSAAAVLGHYARYQPAAPVSSVAETVE